MNKQEALRYLIFQYKPGTKPSLKYGKTQVIRAVTTWNVSLELADSDESKIDEKLLKEVADAVYRGDSVLEHIIQGGLRDMEKKGAE